MLTPVDTIGRHTATSEGPSQLAQISKKVPLFEPRGWASVCRSSLPECPRLRRNRIYSRSDKPGTSRSHMLPRRRSQSFTTEARRTRRSEGWRASRAESLFSVSSVVNPICDSLAIGAPAVGIRGPAPTCLSACLSCARCRRAGSAQFADAGISVARSRSPDQRGLLPRTTQGDLG